MTTEHVAEGVAIDYTEDGKIGGIKILDARKRFGDVDVLKQIVLEDIAFVNK